MKHEIDDKELYEYIKTYVYQAFAGGFNASLFLSEKERSSIIESKGLCLDKYIEEWGIDSGILDEKGNVKPIICAVPVGSGIHKTDDS